MKVIARESAAVSVPDLAEMVKEGTVILTWKGKPLAAVKDLDDIVLPRWGRLKGHRRCLLSRSQTG